MNPILSILLFIAQRTGGGLDDTLARVEGQYPKLAAFQQEIASARAKAQEKRGAFDPSFLFGFEDQRYNSPSAPGKPSDFSATTGAVTWATPQGLAYTVGSRLNSGKPKSPLNATGDLGEHYVAFRVPLLRDLGVNEKSVALRQAELAIPFAERSVEGFRLGLLRDAATVYWEWVGANEKLNIARNLLEISRTRETQVQRRFEAGDEREMSVVEARAETERRAGALAKAERDRQKAALKLGLYLGEPPMGAPRLPEPAPLAPGQVDASRRAVERRPEIAALDIGRRIVQLDRGLAENLFRPSLDLSLGAGVDAGSGGIGATPRVALLLSVPLRQNTANGRLADADAKLRKIELDRQLLVQTVRAEVADAVSAVETSLARVEAARAELALARRLESMERRGFELGEGTLFLLNQRERAAAEAAARLVDVTAEYHQAVAALRAASADL